MEDWKVRSKYVSEEGGEGCRRRGQRGVGGGGWGRGEDREYDRIA